MKLERTPLPATSAHDEVMRLVIARFGEKPLESDTYSVAPDMLIYDWLTSMFTENSFGAANMPHNSSLLVFALDGDLAKAELLGARILATARFGEYPAFFQQGKTTSLFLLADTSVASTHNVWKHSSKTRTLCIANFEDEDARFEVDPYSNETYTQVPADSVLYVDFEGSDIKKGVVPVSRALIQFVLTADNPVFPIINLPFRRSESLFRRFVKWVDASLGTDIGPFRFAEPEEPYAHFYSSLPPDMQVPYVARLVHSGVSANAILTFGVSIEALLLYYLEQSIADPTLDMTPIRTLYADGARLSVRSLSHLNYEKYTSITDGVEIPTWMNIAVDDERPLLCAERAVLREICRLECDPLQLQNALRPFMPFDTTKFTSLLRDGVYLERQLRAFLELEVMGFTEGSLLATFCIRQGRRVRLHPARDMHLMATYASHFDRVWSPSRAKIIRIIKAHCINVKEARPLDLPWHTEKLFSTLLTVYEENIDALLDNVPFSETAAVAMAIRYNDKTLAKKLIAQGYDADPVLASFHHSGAPGCSMYAKCIAKRLKNPRRTSEAWIRRMESSARDVSDGLRHLASADYMDVFHDMIHNINEIEPGECFDALDLDYRRSVDGETLLAELAAGKCPNFEDKIALLLRYGANPWARDKRSRSFTFHIDNDQLRDRFVETAMTMMTLTLELRTDIRNGRVIDKLERGVYDLRGHYVAPPLIFTAIAANNHSAVRELIAIKGHHACFGGMTAMQYAMAMHPALALLFPTDNIHVQHLPNSDANSMTRIAIASVDMCWRVPVISDALWKHLFGTNEYTSVLCAELGLIPTHAAASADSLETAISYPSNYGMEALVRARGVLLGGDHIPSISILESALTCTRLKLSVHASLRRRLDYRTPAPTGFIEFRDLVRAASRMKLAVATVEETTARVKFWKLRSTDVDLFDARRNCAMFISGDLPMVTKQRLVALGCDAYVALDGGDRQGWRHAGFRAMLISHFVPPPHAAIYDLPYNARHLDMRIVISRWKAVYPVPYAVLGWIRAALHFNPHLAHTTRRSSPQYMYFLARHPVTTAILTWHTNLIDFARAALKAIEDNRLHPALFRVMRWLKHPLCVVADEIMPLNVGYYTDDEQMIIGNLCEGAPDSFVPVSRDEFYARCVDGYTDPSFMTQGNSMYLGDYIRTLLLDPDETSRRKNARDLLHLIATSNAREKKTWCLALFTSQLIDLTPREDAAGIWNRLFVDNDDFLSFAHVVDFHTRLLRELGHIGGTAACAIMDILPLSDCNDMLHLLIAANVNPSLRLAMLSHEFPTSLTTANVPMYTLRMFKPEIVRKDADAMRARASVLRAMNDGSKSVATCERAMDLYREKYIFSREAYVERLLEFEVENAAGELTHEVGRWLTRFKYMLDVKAYGPGKHLLLSHDCSAIVHDAVQFIHAMNTRNWSSMRTHAFENNCFPPQASDGLSILAEFARQDCIKRFDRKAREKLEYTVSQLTENNRHLNSPTRDGRRFALVQITDKTKRLCIIKTGVLNAMCSLMLEDVMDKEDLTYRELMDDLCNDNDLIDSD